MARSTVAVGRLSAASRRSGGRRVRVVISETIADSPFVRERLEGVLGTSLRPEDSLIYSSGGGPHADLVVSFAERHGLMADDASVANRPGDVDLVVIVVDPLGENVLPENARRNSLSRRVPDASSTLDTLVIELR